MISLNLLCTLSLLFFLGYSCVCLSAGRECELSFLVWGCLGTGVQIPRLFLTSVCENLFGSLQHILFFFWFLSKRKKKKAICTATVRSFKQYCKRQRSSCTFPVPLLVQQYLYINQFHYFCWQLMLFPQLCRRLSISSAVMGGSRWD